MPACTLPACSAVALSFPPKGTPGWHPPGPAALGAGAAECCWEMSGGNEGEGAASWEKLEVDAAG